MNWTAVGYGVGLLLVGGGVWVGLGALATWATAGARDGQDSAKPPERHSAALKSADVGRDINPAPKPATARRQTLE